MRYTVLLSLFLAAGTGLGTAAADDSAAFDAAIADIGHRWASATYATTDDDRKAAALESTLVEARRVASSYPAHAEPQVWEAIVLASLARVEGGFGALGKAKEARTLLLAAEKLDPNAMDGSIYTTLGSLYAKVPGWPIGFGDKKQARVYLEKALAIDPQGIDANFFYGDFLVGQGDYAGASKYLQHAIDAPARAGRADADAGRRAEAQAMLTTLRQKHSAALAAN
jgi:tetratricopeptide (TPR) repeat protein